MYWLPISFRSRPGVNNSSKHGSSGGNWQHKKCAQTSQEVIDLRGYLSEQDAVCKRAPQQEAPFNSEFKNNNF